MSIGEIEKAADDQFTKLSGWAKIAVNAGIAAVMTGLFAWLMMTSRGDTMLIIKQMREDHREDRRDIQRSTDETREQSRRIAEEFKREHMETRAALLSAIANQSALTTEVKALTHEVKSLKQSIPAQPPILTKD